MLRMNLMALEAESLLLSTKIHLLSPKLFFCTSKPEERTSGALGPSDLEVCSDSQVCHSPSLAEKFRQSNVESFHTSYFHIADTREKLLKGSDF